MTFIDLNGIPNMYPFTEERTIYSRKIAGKPIVEHLLNGNEYWLKSSKKIAIKYPWHLLDVMKHILAAQKAYVSPSAQIADNVHIEGNVYIGDNARLDRGTIILGDVYIGNDSFVGAYSLVRGPCNIEARCKIGYSAELKNAIIQEGTMVGPLCYIADSIVGSDCSFGALTRTSNFRLDRQTVKVKFDTEFVDSQLVKLGAFIGDDVQTGVGVVILPGRKVGNHVHIGPNIVVLRNLQSKKRYMLKQEVTCTELEK